MLAGSPQLSCDPASNRGRDGRAPPLLRGGWEGFGSVMIYEKINSYNTGRSQRQQIAGLVDIGNNAFIAAIYPHYFRTIPLQQIARALISRQA